MSVAGNILAPSACHLADQGLSRLDLLVFLSAPRFQEGRTELLLPLDPRPITPTSHLKAHLQALQPWLPWILPAPPTGSSSLSVKGAFLWHPPTPPAGASPHHSSLGDP